MPREFEVGGAVDAGEKACAHSTDLNPFLPSSGLVPRAAVAAAWARERDLGLTDADIDGLKCFVTQCELFVVEGGFCFF